MNQEIETEKIEILLGNVKYISKLPVENDLIDVTVSSLELNNCMWWHSNVQQHIDRYPNQRADHGWYWPLLYYLTKLSTKKYPVYGFNILGKNNTVEGIKQQPIGMAIVVRNFPYPNDPTKKSSYLWFLTAIPKPLFKDLGFYEYGAVGKGTLDTVLCDAFKNWLFGVVTLHADQAGGPELLKWYTKRGMVPVKQNVRIPTIKYMFRENDGRYFCFCPSSNIETFIKCNDWR